MLRIAARPFVTRPLQRNFVSSVLLGKTYENEHINSLRSLAKTLGVSPKGNKATLILRIQETEKNKTLEAIASRETGARDASTAAAVSPQDVPAQLPETVFQPPPPALEPAPASVTPGIALKDQHTAPLPAIFTNINMPDISQAEPEAATPIPFSPDHWDSNASTITQDDPVAHQSPKLLVVAGAQTHYGGGPTHNANDQAESLEADFFTPTAQPKILIPAGFWRELASEFGIPSTLQLLPEPGSGQEEKIVSRPLEADEKRGLWILFGALAGSVAVSSLITRKPKKVVKHT